MLNYSSKRSLSTLVSWGKGIFGSLGTGDYKNKPHPQIVEYFKDTNIKSIAAGWANSAAITENGELYTWGWELDIQSAIRLGSLSAKLPLLLSAFQVNKLLSFLPNMLTFRSGTTLPTLEENIKDIKFKSVSIGGGFYIAVAENGDVYTWGMNHFGQCGSGDTVATYSDPGLVNWHTDKPPKIIHASAGFQHSILIDDNGLLYGCGAVQRGTLGFKVADLANVENEKLRNFRVINSDLENFDGANDSALTSHLKTRAAANITHKLKNIKYAGCGFAHSFFLTENGEVWACGRGTTGVLGFSNNGLDPELKDYILPERVTLPEPIVQLSVGMYHSIALAESGAIYTWGMSSFGQCGRPPSELIKRRNKSGPSTFDFTVECMLPGKLTLPSGMKIVRVVAGFYESAIITDEGSLYTFGPGSYVPSRLLIDYKVKDVCFAWKHGMALVDKL